jgi:hypothetical protein
MPASGLVDCDQVYVKHDKYGGAGAFARCAIKKGQLVEKGIVRECKIDGESPFVFTWSEGEPRKWATGSGASTFYNMTANPNTHMTRQFDKHTFQIHATRDIAKDEELTHVYISATWRECFKDLKPMAEKYIKNQEGKTPETFDSQEMALSEPLEGKVPGLMDMSKVLVKPDKYGGAGAFARVRIKKGQLIERGIVRELPVDGNVEPFVFTWSQSEPRKWAHGSGSSIFYNMAEDPNTHMIRDFEKNSWTIVALRDIPEGEELTHVYISATWRTCFADLKPIAEKYLEKQKGIIDMKVTHKKSSAFYVNAAKSFLSGTVDKEGNKKEPVCVLNISGLGESISNAVAAAAAVEKEGLGVIKSIETSYPDMSDGDNRGCARIEITVWHKK